jgi:exopolysaccharide biosynthesis polyprenyl glycosylphosphotransferase
MFRLEKVFQNDDAFFIKISSLLKVISILLSIYIFSILEFKTIYHLFNINIFTNSKYYNISIFIIPIYFLISIFLNNTNKYKLNFIIFLRYDILPFIISILLYLVFCFIFEINLTLSFLYMMFFIILVLYFTKILTNYCYNYLINENIIQRNIMLVGEFKDILKLMNEHSEKINIYKCCLIITDKYTDLSKLRIELKIPIFTQIADIRSILEYHSLGQIWILDNKKNDLEILLNNVLKFSVDILIVDVASRVVGLKENLINDKYKFKYYEISKFYGIKLLLKVISDKILSLIFLISFSPLISISMLLIYLEDGFPLFFTQDRTGWDGRRFKIYKLRSLKKTNLVKTIQVIKDDKRITKIGWFIRRFSIDELPQFYNVLIGDMSIVGPRPHPIDLDIKYAQLFKTFLKRHKSVPGLTGWAQVNSLRGATPTPEHMRKRMEYDLWYLSNWTLWLDYFIILKTFYVVFKKID